MMVRWKVKFCPKGYLPQLDKVNKLDTLASNCPSQLSVQEVSRRRERLAWVEWLRKYCRKKWKRKVNHIRFISFASAYITSIGEIKWIRRNREEQRRQVPCRMGKWTIAWASRQCTSYGRCACTVNIWLDRLAWNPSCKWCTLGPSWPHRSVPWGGAESGRFSEQSLFVLPRWADVPAYSRPGLDGRWVRVCCALCCRQEKWLDLCLDDLGGGDDGWNAERWNVGGGATWALAQHLSLPL